MFNVCPPSDCVTSRYRPIDQGDQVGLTCTGVCVWGGGGCLMTVNMVCTRENNYYVTPAEQAGLPTWDPINVDKRLTVYLYDIDKDTWLL